MPLMDIRAVVRNESLWTSVAPRLGVYMRYLNTSRIQRFAVVPMGWWPLDQTDLLAEQAYRYLIALRRSGHPAAGPLDASAMEEAAAAAEPYITRLRRAGAPVRRAPALVSADRESVRALAVSSEIGLSLVAPDAQLDVPVPGCGYVRPGRIDAVSGSGQGIVEIKCSRGREFRSDHLRQLLIYGALRHAAPSTPQVDALCLLNPLRGHYVLESASVITSGVAGMVAEEFFGRLAYVFASGEISR